MQPKVFLVMARASGLDVLVLQRMYRCSYASVAIRLAEGVRHPPLMVVLYENTERGDPAGWKRTPSLMATVVRRTRGMGNPASFTICGVRDGVPRRGSPPSPRILGGPRHTPWRDTVRPRGRLRRRSPARLLEGEAGPKW